MPKPAPTKRAAVNTSNACPTCGQPIHASTVIAQRGRPSRYTPQIAENILNSLASGMSLNKAAQQENIAPSVVIGWRNSDVDGFSERYTRAQKDRHHALADRLQDLATMEPRYITNNLTGERKIDPAFEQWRKTEIATIQWLVSKILANEYGDRVVHQHELLDPSRMSDEELASIAAGGRHLTIQGKCESVAE